MISQEKKDAIRKLCESIVLDKDKVKVAVMIDDINKCAVVQGLHNERVEYRIEDSDTLCEKVKFCLIDKFNIYFDPVTVKGYIAIKEGEGGLRKICPYCKSTDVRFLFNTGIMISLFLQCNSCFLINTKIGKSLEEFKPIINHWWTKPETKPEQGITGDRSITEEDYSKHAEKKGLSCGNHYIVWADNEYIDCFNIFANTYKCIKFTVTPDQEDKYEYRTIKRKALQSKTTLFIVGKEVINNTPVKPKEKEKGIRTTTKESVYSYINYVMGQEGVSFKCPFCGSSDVLHEEMDEKDGIRLYFRCRSCFNGENITGVTMDSLKKKVKRWTTQVIREENILLEIKDEDILPMPKVKKPKEPKIDNLPEVTSEKMNEFFAEYKSAKEELNDNQEWIHEMVGILNIMVTKQERCPQVSISKSYEILRNKIKERIIEIKNDKQMGIPF